MMVLIAIFIFTIDLFNFKVSRLLLWASSVRRFLAPSTTILAFFAIPGRLIATTSCTRRHMDCF